MSGKKRRGRRRKAAEKECVAGTVAFTVRTDKDVFDYIATQVKKGRFSSISEAVNILLKEAIERRIEE